MVTAMFPLGTVLLPGTAVPLHLFEPRYVQMIRDLLAVTDEPPTFGVVMIERGFEVGGGDVRSDVGTLAIATGIEATPQGGYTLLAVGTERIRVQRWLPDDPYPVADVEPWPDERVPDDAHETLRRLAQQSTAVGELAEQVGLDQVAVPEISRLSERPQLALYQLAGAAPIGAADRFKILAAPTFRDCADAFGEALDDASAVLQFRRS